MSDLVKKGSRQKVKKATYQEHVLADYEKQWEAKRLLAVTILTGPSPLNSAWIVDTLRELLFLYMLIAAHREATRVAGGELR